MKESDYNDVGNDDYSDYYYGGDDKDNNAKKEKNMNDYDGNNMFLFSTMLWF